MKGQRGLGLLELLLAIALGSILLLSSAGLIRSGARSLDRFRSLVDEELQHRRLSLLIDGLLENPDFPFPLVRAETHPGIRDALGKSLFPARLRPHAASSVLAVIQLLPEEIFQRVSAETSTMLYCLYSRRPISPRNREYLALGADGGGEILARVRAVNREIADCAEGAVYSVQFSAAKSPLFAAPPRQQIRALVPIAERVAIYQDKDLQLQRFSLTKQAQQTVALRIENFQIAWDEPERLLRVLLKTKTPVHVKEQFYLKLQALRSQRRIDRLDLLW